MFDTWGPYTCKSSAPADIDALWDEFRASEPPNIGGGVGVYVIAVRDKQGVLTPWYIGQTYKSFKYRLSQHFKKKRFEELFSKGELVILLIARAKDGKVLPRQTGGREKLDRKALDWLELDLINASLNINPDLLNRLFKSYLRSIWVGGYRGENALDTTSLGTWPAYKALAEMLKMNPGKN